MKLNSKIYLLLLLVFINQQSSASILTTAFQAPDSGDGVVNVGTLIMESSFNINGNIDMAPGTFGIDLRIPNGYGTSSYAGWVYPNDGSNRGLIDVDYAFGLPGFVVRARPDEALILENSSTLQIEIFIFTDTVGINNTIYYSDIGTQQFNSNQSKVFFEVDGVSHFVNLTYVVPLPSSLFLLFSGLLSLVGTVGWRARPNIFFNFWHGKLDRKAQHSCDFS